MRLLVFSSLVLSGTALLTRQSSELWARNKSVDATIHGKNASAPTVRLVLPCEHFVEQAWVEKMMSGCHVEKVECVDQLSEKQLPTPSTRTVFVVMMRNYHDLDRTGNFDLVTDYMSAHHIDPSGHVLVHIGDEWEKSRVTTIAGSKADKNKPILKEMYRKWGKVFRQFENGLGTFFPLGWTEKFSHVDPSALLPASERKHALTFIGTVQSWRKVTLDQYSDALGKAGLSLNMRKDNGKPVVLGSFSRYTDEDDGYVATLGNSAFCLDLPGASAECYRFYEALEVGCIPVVSSANAFAVARHTAATEAPFIIANPSDVGSTLRTLLRNPSQLDAQQKITQTWWASIKASNIKAFQQSACPR